MILKLLRVISWCGYMNRSFPNLEVVGESSLLSLLSWNFKPNMEKTVCSDDFGHVLLVRLLSILACLPICMGL